MCEEDFITMGIHATMHNFFSFSLYLVFLLSFFIYFTLCPAQPLKLTSVKSLTFYDLQWVSIISSVSLYLSFCFLFYSLFYTMPCSATDADICEVADIL